VTEFELKFQVPRERAASVVAALERGSVQRTRLRARYFDTPDQALARHGLVLRLRQEGREHVQTAKGPGTSGFERLEHNVVLKGAAAEADPALHAEHPVGRALQAALADAKGPLQPVFETDIVRRARVVKAAGTAVEIALDEGHLRAGAATQPVLELEFELKEGSAATLVELAQRWCETHRLWLDPLSKSAAGRRLAERVTQAPPVQAAPVSSCGSRNALLAAILDSGLQQVLGNARELAAATGGDAHVHQARVGLRRVRTALHELGEWSPLPASAAAEASPALDAVFSLLGEHRDRSVLLPKLREELSAADAPLAGWDAPLPDVGAAVRAPEFQLAVLRLAGLVQEISAAAEDGGLKPARQAVRARLRKLHRQALHAGRDFCDLPQAERHRVRKRLKRLRYLAELVRPLFEGDAVDRYVAALKKLQDALGEYQDAVAARQLFEEQAAQDARAWFGAGWLASRVPGLAAACQQACRKTARKARPFWQG
jgi:triphosphatase